MKLRNMGIGLLAVALSAATAMAEDAPAGDPEAGAKVFVRCRACHQIGENAHIGVGPVLNGVVGRKAGTFPNYPYSDANKNSGLTWDVATLTEYLKSPRTKVPGTKMIFAGLTKPADIANVIAFLSQYGADGKKK
jgi:cytochrome c